jgi:hypothetical protein
MKDATVEEVALAIGALMVVYWVLFVAGGR